MAADISVLVCGARGRMGATTVAAVRDADGMRVEGEVSRGDDLAAALARRPDVMVDFTTHDMALGHARAAVAAGVAAVVGTTGLAPEAVDELETAAQGIGGAVIPNFAL